MKNRSISIRLLFLALALGSPGAAARAGEPPAPPPATAPVPPRLDEIVEKLGLTAEQQAQIAPILRQEMSDLKALQADSSLRRAQKARRAREITGAASARIRALLTPPQQQQFDALRDAARDHVRSTLRQRGGRGGGTR